MTIKIEARTEKTGWDKSEAFTARSFESGVRTAARKLGLRGPVLTTERVGSSQWLVNVNGQRMHIIAAT